LKLPNFVTLKLPNLVPRKAFLFNFRIELTAVIKYGLNASLFSSASFGSGYHAADSGTCRSPPWFSRGTGTYHCGGSNLFPTLPTSYGADPVFRPQLAA
jgi:hypothetical protein